MNESQLTTQIKNYLKSKGTYVEKIFGGGYQSAGVPDILCCYRGYFIAIEVKSPTGKGRLSDIQELKIKEIRRAGGVGFVADNLDYVKYIFNMVDDYEDNFMTTDFIKYIDFKEDFKYFT